MRNYLLFICFLLCASVANAQEYRDVVYLKNGSVIKGFYKSFFMNDTLRMETLDGSKIVIPINEIERIAKERTNVYVVHEDELDDLQRRWRPRGYSGSIEIVNGLSKRNDETKSQGFYTTHGYQFNRHLFLGLGLGAETYTVQALGLNIQLENTTYTLFGEGKWYITNTRISPVVICRGGYSISGFKGAFVSPGIGIDFGITPRMGGFINAMFRWQHYNYNWQDVSSGTIDLKQETGNTQYLVFSAGIHF